MKEFERVVSNEIAGLDDAVFGRSGIDGWLFQHFKGSEKPIFGLESLEEHGIGSHVYKYNSCLNTSFKDKKYTSLKWSRLWSVGKDVPLYGDKEGSKEDKHSEIRSKNMGDFIYNDLMLNTHIGFYASGAAHLYDKKGIIRRLEKRNLRVIRK
jgi:hypothetical protein